jgi:Ca-activated chloride channel family protein
MFQTLWFHNPHFLWLLLLLPALAAWNRRTARRRPALRFSATRPLAEQRWRGWRVQAVGALPWLRLLALGLAIVALARPQSRGSRLKDLSVEGIDIVVALDSSRSMEAGDFRPLNRMHVAKQVLDEFISSRANDRVGLVVFSGAAYTQAPLTFDYGVLKQVVSQLSTGMVEDGTAIGDALAVSLNRLRDSDAKSKVVVLITDGDNNAGRMSPMDAAEMARALNIPIFTILVGKGGAVPYPASAPDLFGNTVWREREIPINPELLKNISSKTGGEYYRAVDRDSLRAGLQKVLDSMERTRLLEGGATAQYAEEYRGFLTGAFAFLLLELLLGSTLLRVFP